MNIKAEYSIYIYIGIAVIGLLLGLFLLFLYIRKTKRKDSNQQVLSKVDSEKIYVAVGLSENIDSISIEQQRIRLVLNDIKKVNTKQLTELKIPAFLKGNELKLLIKGNPKEVFDYIERKRKVE